MKNKMLALALGALLVSVCIPAYAYEEETWNGNERGNWEAGFDVAGAFPTDPQSEVLLTAELDRALNPQWALGVSVSWTDPNFKADGAGFTDLNAGSVTMIPVFFDIIYRFKTADKTLRPYFDLGVGGVFASHHGQRDLNPNNLNAEAQDGFAMKFGLGVDWDAWEDWVWNVEGGYVWNDASLTVRSNVDNSETDNIDLDYWYLGGGLKYQFG
ncbi:MAG TPA: OmpW family outer membrane protein [Candidatus Eisenbacteria bacterium]|nr:OmpW family outer membrane protein [Candidatus Eisenbacteria bacterium]